LTFLLFIGSPFACHVYSSDFTFENYEYASINKRTSFIIKPKIDSIFNPNILVDIITPSGKRIEGKIEEKSLNIYILHFLPNEIGDHRILFYNDKDKKSIIAKFISQIYDATKIQVSDLPSAVPHRLCKFTSKVLFLIFIDEELWFRLVNTTEAGDGLLNIKIKQNGNRLNHEQMQIVPHIYEISFIPETSDECLISISFNGENNCKF
jgi:hypothetical protein